MKTPLLICVVFLLSFRAFSQSCTLTAAITPSAQTICSGNSVVLTVATSGGTAPFNYVWSTGETTPSINVNKAGTYTVSVSDNTSGCTAIIQNVTVTSSPVPNAPTAQSVVVCENSTATLKATAPGGIYQWYDATGSVFLGSGDTFITPAITASTHFYVQTTMSGCTSPRTAVFAYLNAKPSVKGAKICAGNIATISASGGNNYTWYDAIAGGNIVSTSQTFTTPVLNASQTYYVVVISSNGCVSAPTAVAVKVIPPPQAPTAPDVTVCSGGAANLHATGTGIVFNWYTVPVGGTPLISSPDYTTPPLTTTTVYYVENLLNDCVSPRAPVTVSVNSLPAAPPAQSDTICYGTSAVLQAGANPSGICQWYNAASGGYLLATGATYNTPNLYTSITYYVQIINGGCNSALTPVQVIVKPAPSVPSASGSIICPGSVTALTAVSQAGICQWFDAAIAGNLLATGPVFVTPPLTATTIYYVQNTLSGCTSSRAAVTVTVFSSIPPPAAKDKSVCYGSPVTLTATGSNGSYAWYDRATGGNLLSTGEAYNTSDLTAATTYYVEATGNGCASTRIPVTVTVAAPPLPIIVKNTSVCTGAQVSLTASGAGIIEWYDAVIGGKLLATGNTFNTPAVLANTTYYLQYAGEKCFCTRTPVTVSINPVTDPQFQYLSGTFCASGQNPLPVIYNPSGGTFSALPSGLLFISTSTGQINVGASTPGIYVITFTSINACPGTTSAKVAIVSAANSAFAYNGPYCQDGINPLPIFLGQSSAGVFSASPTGLYFLNTSTGEIDLAKSSPGTYTITNTIYGSGGCAPSVSTVALTVYQQVTVSAGPPQLAKKGATVQLAGSVTGAASGGRWFGGAGSFSNPSDPNAIYTPGNLENTATLTFTSNSPPGPCGPKSDMVTITFVSRIPAPVVPPVSTCFGSNATISAIGPGGNYQWYDAAIGGNLLSTKPTFVTHPLTSNTTYYVQTTGCGFTSKRTAVTVTVNAIPAAPIIPVTQICSGYTATLSAGAPPGSYQWYDSAVGGNLLSLNNTYITPALTINTTYFVQTTANGCTSNRTPVMVTVTPVPTITSSSISNVCSGSPLNYTITSNVTTATFLWSRTQVTGINNPALTNQNSATINDNLINTGSTAVNVIYVITPMAGSCSGQPFNLAVTVNPAPVVTSTANAALCNYSSADYEITFNTPGTFFNWSRPAMPGIYNAPVSGQTAATIKEILFNTTNAPINVPYTINFSTGACPGTPFNFVITVNPYATVTSTSSGTACSGVPQNYAITSNVPSASFTWSRAAVSAISNPAITNQTSGVINETLINTSTNPVGVSYTIIPEAYGCRGQPFYYFVAVNPQIPVPVANSNSPVCEVSTINLATPVVPNASYLWTGPNGYLSTAQNPVIENASAANSGIYTLVTIINGCPSPPSPVTVVIDAPPIAAAGANRLVCISAPSILLAGNVSGGTTTGIWTTAGTGSFAPSINTLNAHYIPSNADRAAGSVSLTLSSTSKDNCSISTSGMTISFGPSPSVIAGKNQDVCSQVTNVKLDGRLLIPGGCKWNTSGTGTFSPSDTLLNADYIPGAEDARLGIVTLTLIATNADSCYIPIDSMTVKFTPPPTMNAGGTRYVLKGNTITLYPTVSTDSVSYLWSPSAGINDVSTKNPVITGDIDRNYTLTVIDTRGCVSQSQASIIVSPKITVDNAFTPNGDGINDLWDITGLIAYSNATVDVFTRYGQRVFHSYGYPKPWDGTYNGQPLPFGAYYYVIDLNVNRQVLSGNVTIIK